MEYDSYDFRKPRAKRIGLSGRPTSLTEETELQISCVVHYRKRCLLDRELREKTRLFAISPNDNKLPVHVRVLAKRMGKIAGPHDIQFIDKRRGFYYWWLEMKAANKIYTIEQEDFANFFTGTPIKTKIIYMLDDFIEVLDS